MSTGRGSIGAYARRPSRALSIAFTAVHGRAEWPLTPRKMSRAFMLPRQPAWIVLSVGSSRIASSASCTSRERSKRSGSGLNSAGSSSWPKARRATSTAGSCCDPERPSELDHHRQAALHVARSQPDHGAVLDPAGDVLLSRHRVVVAGEHDRGARRFSGRPDEGVVACVLGARRTAGTSERTCAANSASLPAPEGCPRARACGRKPVGEGGHRRQAWHNPRCDDAPAAGRTEPERGLVLAVLPKSADAEEELGELRELGARPAWSRSASSSSSARARSASVCRQGRSRS